MAQTEGKAVINNFVGGLVTDYHELNTPQNTTVDEDNCDLDRKGSRKRRLGIDYETDYELTATGVDLADLSDLYLKTYKWSAINNDGNLNFLVVQTGSILTFFDLAFDTISANRKDFEVDLDDFKINVESVASHPIQVTSGKGVLFVVGKYITPFFIEYDATLDDIETTEIELEIRDLVQQENDSSLIETRPTVLTDDRKYDLFNQGWSTMVAGNDSVRYGETVTTTMNALEYYFFATDHYPPKSKPWWVGKRAPIDPGESGFELFDPTGVYDRVDAGNTLGPLGHYVLDPFNKDRTAVSGIPGFTPEVKDTRPTAVAFYSGRVFYGHENTIYFSQILFEDLLNAGKCYQSADPTAEEINELIATDGGTILIPESSTIIGFTQAGNSLIIFSENGVWMLGGASPGDGFSSTGFSIGKVSSVGLKTNRSIVDVEGMPFWWNDQGIYTLVPDQGKHGFTVQNICHKKVQGFYDEIPTVSKDTAAGAYDDLKKVITWIFNSNEEIIHNNQYACNRMLNYDLLLAAFYPYTLGDLDEDSPFIADVFSSSSRIRTIAEDVVTDSGVTVTDGGEDVFVGVTTYTNTSERTGIKFLTYTPIEL